MPKQKKIQILVGDELPKKVKELEATSKDETAKQSAYYTVNKNGIEKIGREKV